MTDSIVRTRTTGANRFALGLASLAAVTLAQPLAYASSHREAPMIAGMPRLDATDFYMFRSYETGRSNYVTMIADYIPLQDGYGGPNFFNLESNGYYDINVDETGAGKPTFSFRFRFTQTSRNISLPVGGKKVAIPLINAGQITRDDASLQNVLETYTVSFVNNVFGSPSESLLKTPSGQSEFLKPVDNIGDKSVPNYTDYANTGFTKTLVMPGCGNARVFVGQRREPFVVNLGETFDLLNYAHPVGEQYARSAKNDLAFKNIMSLIVEVPIACLTQASNSVIGAWTTSSLGTKGSDGTTTYKQVSRLGNPLVNELVIGLKDKDTFNGSLPANDAQFLNYVTNPTAPALVEALYPSFKAPTKFPRNDLVAVFLTGVAGVNQPASVTPSEEMRLNVTIPPTPFGKQNRLGVIGGDNAGYPNGRRPGDDVVDITLRVAMGKLYALGLYGTPADAPAGNVEFTDGAFVSSAQFQQTFPYLQPPLSSSPQPIHTPPSASASSAQ